MKMTKLLAGGVAAALAVTSLASVVSAETKVFDMSKAKADRWHGGAPLSGDVNKEIGGSIKQAKMQKVEINLGGISAGKDEKGNDLPWDYKCLQAQGDVIMTVTGTKVKDKAVERVTKEYKWDIKDSVASIVVLEDDEPIYRDGEFAPAYFDTIETVKISYNYWGCTTEESVYNSWKDGFTADIGNAIVSDWDAKTQKGTKVDEYAKDIDDNKDMLEAAEENKAAALLAYAFTNGGYAASKGTFGEYLIPKGTLTIKKVYPFIGVKVNGVNNTLLRDDFQLLSYADANKATSNSGNQDKNQSYIDDDTTKGTNPKEFAGLASQVGDFFNKQTNGTITFKVTLPDAAGSTSGWFENGVPSTQVGIKNALLGFTTNDVALAFNYDQTGSLLATTSIDAASSTITFDISDVLDALGGQTIGVIDNIYVGLAKGVKDNGIYVEEITLAYEEDADVEADIEDDDAAVEEDDDATVEEDDDVAIEDDDTATEDDDTDGEVAGDVIDTPVVEDDDANPGTGVALAVVPAMVAAAAVVLSKKRK